MRRRRIEQPFPFGRSGIALAHSLPVRRDRCCMLSSLWTMAAPWEQRSVQLWNFLQPIQAVTCRRADDSFNPRRGEGTCSDILPIVGPSHPWREPSVPLTEKGGKQVPRTLRFCRWLDYIVGIWRRFKDTCCKELTFIQKEAGWLRREEDNCVTVQEWMYLQVLLCGINVRAVVIMYGCTHPYIRNVKNRDYEQVTFYLHITYT